MKLGSFGEDYDGRVEVRKRRLDNNRVHLGSCSKTLLKNAGSTHTAEITSSCYPSLPYHLPLTDRHPFPLSHPLHRRRHHRLLRQTS